MEIIEFQGTRCTEKSVNDWQKYCCKHLKRFVSAPGEGLPTSISRVLQDGTRTSEIFLVVNGPLPKIESKENSHIAQNKDHITCNQCWINVYAANNL